MFLLRIIILAYITMLISACSLKKNQDLNTIEKKEINKKENKKTSKVKKEHASCKKYKKTMLHASSYIKEEFYEGYFLQKDYIGARAQLFLIENNSTSIFAQNINIANDSYLTQYNLAKKQKCSLKKFRITPILKVQNIIKAFEKQSEKK